MTLFEALLLGMIQGFTEFLPVSSSGHLVLGSYLLGIKESHLLFDVIVHVATLCAILIFYRKTIFNMVHEFFYFKKKKNRSLKSLVYTYKNIFEIRLFFLIIFATIPTTILGLLFKDHIENLFIKPKITSIMLVITGFILFTTRFFKHKKFDIFHMNIWHTFIIGCVQACAIIPGISRSGSTIAIALFLGFDRELSARFSFLLSIPVIIGALILTLKDAHLLQLNYTILSLGFISSAITGFFALKLLVNLVRKGNFYSFSIYLIPMGIISFFLI